LTQDRILQARGFPPRAFCLAGLALWIDGGRWRGLRRIVTPGKGALISGNLTAAVKNRSWIGYGAL